MLSEKESTSLSKFLSLVLRHQPETIGIDVDNQGWVNVKELLEKTRKSGRSITIDVLKFIVENNPKKRFEFNDNLSKIRASQGHSIKVDLGYEPQTPPDILYHGTASKFIDSIIKAGLEKRSRQHVHLSKDMETAVAVGQRHGKPVILKVLTKAMFQAGHEFFISTNGVWLTDKVPVEFLKIEELIYPV
jgi:putative RNA 2'-phosphotransferase